MSGILSVRNWGIGNSEGDAGFEERLARGKKGLLEMSIKGMVQFSFKHPWLSLGFLSPLPCVPALLLSH